MLTLYNPGPVAEMITEDGFGVRDLGMRSNTELGAVTRLRRILREGKYDVLHAHLYRSQIYGKVAAFLAGTPVVLSTEHSIGETHLERRRMSAGVRMLYFGTDLLAQRTIAVSDIVASRLRGWGMAEKKITVIPNGMDLDRAEFDSGARDRIRTEFNLDPNAYVLGVLGRVDPNKRFDLVIEAAAPLLGEKVKLLIVGDGAGRGELEALAAKHSVAEHVVFAGERHDVGAMLSALDLFIAASEQETFGLSVLEALVSGIPALYTTCPALDPIDTDRATQVPGTVDGMRAAMADEIAGGHQERRGVPEIGATYGIDVVASRIDDLYEEIAANRRKRR